MYVLAEKWGQRPDQILDGMTSAELSEAIAYYLLAMEEQNQTAEQREHAAHMERSLAEQRQAAHQARGMGGS